MMKYLSLTILCYIIFSITTHNAFCDNSSTTKCRVNKKWRDPICDQWIYSETETLEPGYKIVILDQPNELGDLDCDFILYDFWNRRDGVEPEYFPHSYDIIVLATGEIPSSSETLLLCKLLYKLVFIEKWITKNNSDIYSKCRNNRQNPSLYDEAIRRLKLTYHNTSIIDLFIVRHSVFINWSQ